MISRRRLTFQLTPLLDLLLIVIFAQFMDTQETTARIEQRAETKVAQAEQQIAQLEKLSAAEQDRVSQLTAENAKALQSIMKSREAYETSQKSFRMFQQQSEKTQMEQSEQIERLRDQRDRVGELVQQLFQLPEDTLDPLLKSKGTPDSPETREQRERIRKQLKELAEARGEDVVRHFLTYDELTKRSDIWDLYLTENGVFQLQIGDKSADFRAATKEEFVDRFYAVYKTTPQPKSLVIILFSYGDAKASVRFAATQGLPLVAERMRADSSGRTRFEYAVMGFVPQSTVSTKKQPAESR